MSNNNDNNKLMLKLIEIIETEEYDTCSIDIDLELFVEYDISDISNIEH